MFDTSNQSGVSSVLQSPQAVANTVTFSQIKRLRKLHPENLEDLKQLFDIVDQISRIFIRRNARWEIIPLQRILLPLITSATLEELYTTDSEHNDPAITDPNRTIFGTDVAGLLAQVAHQLGFPGFTNPESVKQYLDQYARAGSTTGYSVEGIRKEYHQVISLIKLLYEFLYNQLEAAGQKQKEQTEEEKPEALQDEPAEEPVAAEPKKSSSDLTKLLEEIDDDDDDDNTNKETSAEESAQNQNLSPEQKAQLQAFSQHDQRALLTSYQGLLASSAAFLLSADQQFSGGKLSDEQMAMLFDQASSFLKERYGDAVPNLSPADRAHLVRDFQIAALGKSVVLRELFQKSISDVLGPTSPIVEKNIENTLDSMLLSSGPKSIVDMIDALDAQDADFVAQMFGIPQKLDEQSFEKLKQLIVLYAMAHGNELGFQSGSPDLFARLEAKAIKITDPDLAQRVGTFRSFLKTYNSASGKDNGAEILANALGAPGDSRDSLMRKARERVSGIQEMYEGLWNSLSPEEKRKTAQHIALLLGEQPPDPTTYLGEIAPPFIELVDTTFFSTLAEQIQQDEDYKQAVITKVEEIQKTLVDNPELLANITADQEALAANNLQQMLVETYIADSTAEEKQQIIDHFGTNQAGAPRANPLQLEQWQESTGGTGGAPPKRRFFGFGRTEKQGASSITKTLKRVGVELASKGVAAISVFPGGTAALTAIRASEATLGKKTTWTIIGGGALGAAGILGYMLSTSGLARLLGATGAIGGGVLGGLGGFLAGGTLAIPAAGAGALAGGISGTVGGYTFEMAARKFLGIGSGGATAPATSGASGINPPKFTHTPKLPPTTSAPAPTPPTTPVVDVPPPPEVIAGQAAAPAITTAADASISQAAANAVANMSIATIAPLFAIGSVGFMSFITIFTMYAAFLVPLPNRAVGNSVAIPRIAGLEGCWPTTGNISTYLRYTDTGKPHATSNKPLMGFPGPGVAIDIGTSGTRPPIFTPFTGLATFYPEGTGVDKGYGNHVVIKTTNFALIFAHLSSFAVSIDTPTGTRNISGTSVTSNVPVVAGDGIGFVGDTGNSKGMHLHYEVFGVNILDILPLTPAELSAIAADEDAIIHKFVSPAQCAKPSPTASGGQGEP